MRCVSPSALSAKDVGKDTGHLDYTLYDAVLTSEVSSPVDPEIEKFLPLLKEYLISASSTPSRPRSKRLDAI
jgi:hypothetical protein